MGSGWEDECERICSNCKDEEEEDDFKNDKDNSNVKKIAFYQKGHKGGRGNCGKCYPECDVGGGYGCGNKDCSEYDPCGIYGEDEKE